MKCSKLVLTSALCAAVLALASCGQNNAPAATSADTSAAPAETTTEKAAETEASAETTETSEEVTDKPEDSDEGITQGYFDPGVYAAVKDGVIESLYYFDDAAGGHTENMDGIGGVPFSYEQNFDEVTFHFGGPDDTTKMSVHPDDLGYTVGKFETSGDEYIFTFMGETGDHDVALPETEAVNALTIPGVYSGMNRGEFMNFYIFDDETNVREMYMGGTGYTATYELSDGKIVFHDENGDVPVKLRLDDYLRPIGEYEGSGAIITFSYIRGADPKKIVLAEEPQSEGYEPPHPFQYTDLGWEMENVPDMLMDMNGVAGRNNAFMLQLDKAKAQDGFEAHFIFLDKDGLIIADHAVKQNTVEDAGIAPAPMLGAMDIVVYPVKLKDLMDTYDIDLADVARFYITDDPNDPCIELVTIEQN